jgi:hypothetical protein
MKEEFPVKTLAIIPLTLLGFISISHACQAQSPARFIAHRLEDPIFGTWEWTVSMGPMKKELSMVVEEKEGEWFVVVKAPDGNEVEVTDFTLEDDRVHFTVHREERNRSMTMTYDGELKGDKINGTIKMSGGPINTTLKWKATKLSKK